jgi:hypothetical protein
MSFTFNRKEAFNSVSGTEQTVCTRDASSNSSVKALRRSFGEVRVDGD